VSDIVCFGELLWDMLPTGKVIGGAPFNIVNRANALGTSATVISAIGNDDLGQEIIAGVQSKGNSTDYISVLDTLPTGVVNIEVAPSGEPHYDIVHPVAWDNIPITIQARKLIENCKVFIYSSLGLRDERSREALFSVLPLAQKKVCDINLRKGHYEKSTIQRMIDAADVLRMNEYELQMVAEWHELNHLNPKEQIIKLANIYNYEEVITTLGGDGAVCYDGNHFYNQPVFKVDVVDTVGAGDAFLATYVSSRLNNDTIPDALRKGCIVGGLTAAKAGGTPDISIEEIEKMEQLVN